MARLLPVLAMMAHDVMCHDGGVKHVMAGEEYGITNRQEKSISPRGFGNEISEVNFKECQEPKDSTSFHDFTTEDIEKLNNVSFSDPEYAGKVRTSPSSSITTIVTLFSFKGVVSCQPCLLLRLHPAVLLSQCTYREVRGQAL